MNACAHGTSNSAPLPRGVRRALDAMRGNPGRDWSVTELAGAAGLSSRTLQRQFRLFLGKTPRAALRDVRFESARRELLQGLPDAKVMDVALRCGFPHFGRFSVDYRRQFGETPSQTLKRQAVFNDALSAMPASFVSSRDQPMVALGPIDAAPEHGGIARSIADELTTALNRAGAIVTRQPGAARYHLVGTINGSDRQTHLTLRLIDAETGRHLTAHRSDGPPGDDTTLDEHLATKIVAAMQPCLRLAEIDRAGRKPDADLSPHDLALRAMPFVLSLNAEGNAYALDLLERAMKRDPGHALATALAAWAYGQRVVYHFATTPTEDRARSAELARKAQSLGGDATVLAVLGNALTFLHDLDAANLIIRKALSIDGGSAWAWSRSGWIDVYNGDADSGIERFKIALDLAPHDSLAFNSMVGIGCAHFESGRYSEAAHWQQRALTEHPSATWIHRTMCPAYVLIGDESEARRSVTALREDYPELTITDVQQGLPPLPQSYCDRVFDALHSVGLPL
ncbi:helix-turn-helix domain-containing protein [Bradyrhizobium sediminis]|uniref:Helix-turn-helix domain-containing protein n=1 Tax=Bradyrhizobium sediminis TaxID=2840469 RepID=A0A975NH82_9BRAD|nr:helix-turn-helix domain-containing protein [Bradyrhizobium sediminis]QWG14755.1 helix-turn-helix domain-containing protein [Bradyrhizobium sediminis]